uniref:Palmitoyltransferase n=1 Tax=Attheya septentrionalis TaxID=420275 RepID=A0A7S2UH71_9STRA|mmetsp:Transcript_25420/g.46049  ORF Transcript_25420/g.46049 Transcript_25420/m.46049 type:complete len:355 (+) Transcript_25420:172-1236(+)
MPASPRSRQRRTITASHESNNSISMNQSKSMEADEEDERSGQSESHEGILHDNPNNSVKIMMTPLELMTRDSTDGSNCSCSSSISNPTTRPNATAAAAATNATNNNCLAVGIIPKDVERGISISASSATMDDEDLEEEEQHDMERLLESTPGNSIHSDISQGRSRSMACCEWPYRIGNMRVLCPKLHRRTGGTVGVIGPHWMGPIAVLALLGWASFSFTHRAFDKVGPISGAISIAFAVSAVLTLLSVVCRDPGVVTLETFRDATDGGGGRVGDWRWCDLCSVHQPPKASHCPDCNVCISEFDHHCVWMGKCIGEKNKRVFLFFNASWVFYLLYSIVWVTTLGPLLFHHHHHTS